MRGSGTPRLVDSIARAPGCCHHPEYLAYAGSVLLIVAIGAKIGSIAN
jgi:hypothetical protein